MDISRLKVAQAWLQLAEGVRVKCRYLTSTQLDEIKQQSTETEMRGAGQSISTRNEEKFRSLLGRAVVIDWEGLENDGQPYPCTPENIDYLMEEYAEFRML
ncbi:MAG: hypothetical protein L3J63_11840, partial [Geopsychrobacter sp.]|nr:hypothetical protein [Geopsychrobacter sp.]